LFRWLTADKRSQGWRNPSGAVTRASDNNENNSTLDRSESLGSSIEASLVVMQVCFRSAF
jgi:hypothetical protein